MADYRTTAALHFEANGTIQEEKFSVHMVERNMGWVLIIMNRAGRRWSTLKPMAREVVREMEVEILEALANGERISPNMFKEIDKFDVAEWAERVRDWESDVESAF